MKTTLTLGMIMFALSFCGLQERLQSLTGGGNSNTSSTNSNSSTSSSGGDKVEAAKPTSAQQAIIDAGTEAKWDEQGISWKLPSGWKKQSVAKEQFFYMGPDNSSIIVSISAMPDSFPMDVSQKAYYEQALQQVKNGKYESAKMVEIDGVQGVEFTEVSPAKSDDVRRHQWIAYRTYLGQKQQVNIITATKGANFSKHSDEFTAIIYSTKFVK
ncbi:MAG: hypothetical protein JNL64_13090 [Blastocatellia bacterium]|nr:hypothetical protein [Blastocatellia bacterium]